MKVWVGFTHNVGEQGYQDPHTSEPIEVFEDEKSASKWKKNGRDRKIKSIITKKFATCKECGHKL